MTKPSASAPTSRPQHENHQGSGHVSQDHGGRKRVTRPMRGFTPYEAGQDTLVGTERRPRLKKAQCARRRHQRQHRWNRFVLTVLLDRGEFGARPLRVDDELERIELLVSLPQPVKRLPAEIRQGLARAVGEEP